MIIVESSLPKTAASTDNNCAKGVRVRTVHTLYGRLAELIIVFGCGASRLGLVEMFVLPPVSYTCRPLSGRLVGDAGRDGVGGSFRDAESPLRLPLIFGV